MIPKAPHARSPALPRHALLAARSKTTTATAASTISGTPSSGSPRRRRRYAGSSFRSLLTARAENHIRGNPDLDDTLARLQAFDEAGADVLYAPGLRTVEEIRTVCEAVSRPVNVLARPDLSTAEVVEAGAQRISVGGALTWTAVNAAAAADSAIRDRGDFSQLGSKPPLEEWFAPGA